MESPKTYIPNIPEVEKKRIVVVGGGFAGLKFVRKSLCRDFQVVMLDRNNYHQFQPLLYQVATAGLEPSSISFPLRKVFQTEKHIHYRMGEVFEVFPEERELSTSLGYLKYDYLVLAMGADTNFFGQTNIQQNALTLKSASDAILIRNTILENFEAGLMQTSPDMLFEYLTVVLVGGGPTGVELAGALAEMKKYIFPKDYPELDLSKMRIILYEASPNLLSGMSANASRLAKYYLERLGIEVKLSTSVVDYDGQTVKLSDGTQIATKTMIWAAGVKANAIKGLSATHYGRGNRIVVDRENRIAGYKYIFAIGDLCIMSTPRYPNGHPQVAQVAIQQANKLAKNIHKIARNEEAEQFRYIDKGSMATVGRNLAVADLPGLRLRGFIAWFLWGFVHLISIVGVKNKLFIFLNWSWNYFTYDQSLRVLIKPKIRFKPENQSSETP